MTESIFKEEEKALLLNIEKAKASSNNGSVIGRNGEIPLLNFLNNYLPPTLKAVSGHFLTPGKKRSPQIDIIIVDSRYPLLGYNSDGTVLVMAHSVVKIIEIKTNLKSAELIKTVQSFSLIWNLLDEVWQGERDIWDKPSFTLFSYYSKNKIDTVEKNYVTNCNPLVTPFDLIILRADSESENGMEIAFDYYPIEWGEIDINSYSAVKGQYTFSGGLYQRTPLADFYYNLIQNSYYIIDEREYSLGNIGAHFNQYLNFTHL